MRVHPRKLRKKIAATSAALLATLGLAVAGAAGASPAGAATASCSAAYSVQSDWGSGFTASLTVTNNGSAAITGWTVTWTYAGNQTLSSGWSGTWSQSGKTVTVTNASWNGALAPASPPRPGQTSATAEPTPRPPRSPARRPGQPPRRRARRYGQCEQPAGTQGNTATVGISLSQQPSANVTVSVARSSGNTGLTAAPASLTFTPANYATAQPVTVTADATSTGAATFTASADRLHRGRRSR